VLAVRLALAALCGLLLTSCDATPLQRDLAGGAAVTPGVTGTVTLGDRPFRLHVPTTYDDAEPTALVVALHGWRGTSHRVEAQLDLEEASESHGFLLALPEGEQDSLGRQFWNAAPACCNADGRDVDDSGYLSSLIDEVARRYRVDPARVYAVGVSNGGFMAHRLACDHADQVVAVVSVAGGQAVDPADCRPSQGVSVLQVHGTADATIRYDGGSIIPGQSYPSAEQTVDAWRELEHCAAGPGLHGDPLDGDPTLPGAETARVSWSTGCADASEVALWTVDGGGHSPHITPDFTEALLDWLEGQSRAPST
jgi:polyhydroxybutyrate depolymerase